MLIRRNRIGRRWTGVPQVTPRSLFLNGTDGVCFDFGAPAGLFTDAAGATPLTAPGQTIGLACDKSRTRAPVTSFAGIQASAGLRPTYGRAPKSRRNRLTATETFVAAVNMTASVAPGGTLLVTASGQIDGRTHSNYVVAEFGLPVTISASARADGARYIHLGRAGAGVWFDLVAGTVLFATAGMTGTISAIGTDGLRRLVVMIANETIANGTATQARIYVSVNAPSSSLSTSGGGNNGVDGVVVNYLQLEQAAAATAYQKVTSAFDVTETGQPAFGYARLDGADDKLTVTLPSAITGDLMIFGRSGSWIEAGVTLPSGAFDLGPTGTVLTAGILRALGDLVGTVIIGRSTTATERALALRYFAARGAAGWLAAGAEVLANGGFASDTAGWTFTNATGAVVGGELEFTATVAGAHNVQRGVAVTPGTPYLLSFDARLGTMTVLRYSVYNATGAANIIAPTTYAATGATKRFQFVFTPPAGCVTANVYMARDSGSAGTAYFDNVSCKPLTVGA